MEIKRKVDLTHLNTFGVKAEAKFFAEIFSEEDLIEILNTPEFKNNEKLFLGEGSNILFTRDFPGIVILNRLSGIKIVKENENEVLVRSMGGERWDDLVSFAVNLGYWGIENMAGIPGTVGASPVQNIGAYGVELKDVISSVEVYDISTGERKFFQKDECEFGYRESIFKNKYRRKYFISAITVRLSKNKKQNLDYPSIKEYMEKNKLTMESSRDIASAVVKIRKGKLPDPSVLGSAGSFFKNVFVGPEKLKKLKLEYPDIPFFEEGKNIKIPTGWLVEKCGPGQDGVSWKGYKEGNVGVYERQALVIVNYGGATGLEIKNFAQKIIVSILEKFSIMITPEVNLI